MPCIHPQAHLYTCKTCHLCHTQTVFMPSTTVQCGKTDNTGEVRSQIQQMFSVRRLGADKGRHWDLWPQMLRLILGKESIRGLASLVMNYSTFMPPWEPVAGSVETRVKGLWLTKPLIPQQPRTLWSASLWRREDLSSPTTLSPSELSRFSSHHFYPCVWTRPVCVSTCSPVCHLQDKH